MDKKVQFPVYINNSLKRKKEKFNSLHPDKVGMYVCGPTVYGDPHLGHARGAVTFDIVYRYLSFLGYKVRFVRNITDVGHMEDEVQDNGEDKIAKKARLEQVEPMEIAQLYTNRYHEAVNRLNCLPPSIEPTATGHIPEQIEMIERIVERGFGYVVEGNVYFDISKYDEAFQYGELSGKILEDLVSGSRSLEGQEGKRNPQDFALWKKAKPEHIMQWSSPWGKGFPGWHLECTAMSAKYLGIPFDIHGGGMDLQFPHHEGEIAQSFGAYGCAPVNYWMHNNMLTIQGQKMAKSKGNFINLEQMFSGEHELLDKAYSPMTIRYFMLQSHYGSTIDFSNEALQAAEKGYQRLMSTFKTAEQLLPAVSPTPDETVEQTLHELCDSCYKNMSDDFNTATTIASLFELSKKINEFHHNPQELQKVDRETLACVVSTYKLFIEEVLGLKAEDEPATGEGNGVLDGVLDVLIDIRKQAKSEKNFALADQIRDQLKEAGVQLKDEKGGGTTYDVIK